MHPHPIPVRGDRRGASSPSPASLCTPPEETHVATSPNHGRTARHEGRATRLPDDRLKRDALPPEALPLLRRADGGAVPPGPPPRRDLLRARAGGNARRRRRPLSRPDDSLFPTHRDLSAQLTKGLDLKRVMAQFWGRIDGYTRGRDGNSHIGDWQGTKTFDRDVAPADRLPGRASARRWPTSGAGDRTSRWRSAATAPRRTAAGTSRSNWSAIFELPVVWVVNNNLFAYSTPNPLEFRGPDDRRARRCLRHAGRARRRCGRARGVRGGARGRRARPRRAAGRR